MEKNIRNILKRLWVVEGKITNQERKSGSQMEAEEGHWAKLTKLDRAVQGNSEP